MFVLSRILKGFSTITMLLGHNWISAQVNSFAPLGAIWYYDSMDSGLAPPHSEYFLYESVKDTIVSTIPCRKVEIKKYAYTNTIIPYLPLFVYGDTNEVFYFNNQLNKFCSLYKFDVAVGDTLSYYTLPNSQVTDSVFKVVVDSVYYQPVSNKSVKFIYTIPTSTFSGYSLSYWGPYCQYFGGLNSMLPQPTPNIPEMDGPLRCYSDTTFSFNNYWPYPCDYRIIFNGINNLSSDQSPDVRYDYLKDMLFIGGDLEKCKVISIYDILGRIVFHKNLPQADGSQIKLSFLPKGFYIANVINSNGELYASLKFSKSF